MTSTVSFVPADTRSMGIVHNALRRDLTRAREVLCTVPYPHPRQRRALAAHLVWVMAFLHRHHETEESGLYPLVRRDRAAEALLEQMEAEHAALLPGIAAVDRAAAGYAVDAAARATLVAALDDLIAVLYPHLAREEDDLMPLAARAVSQREWDTWEQGVAGALSMKEKTAVGPWLLEGASPEETAHMVKLVPPVPRWIILNVLSRGYRKQAFARWWCPEFSPWKLVFTGSNSVTVSATPEQVWAVLADVTRVGEWSHECHGARWLDGATAGGVGVRFAGSNKVRLRTGGGLRYSRPCTITSWVPGCEFSYVAKPTRLSPRGASQWSFFLESVEGGTRLTQAFCVLHLPVLLERLAWIGAPTHRDRGPALRADLERLARLIDRQIQVPS
jgi:hemerythrin-like domain-containing protein